MVEQTRDANLGRPTLWEFAKSSDIRIGQAEQRVASLEGRWKIMLELEIATLGLVGATLLAVLVHLI